MIRRSIDTLRPTALYLSMVAILLFAVFVIGRVHLPLAAMGLDFPHRTTLAAACLSISVLAGLYGAGRHEARALAPWRVPQSQVLLVFLVFFIFGAIGIVLSA